ncbi:hypothetical protein ACIQXF_17615 [Lysinibacillus sp. NPDC097231]
MRSKNKKYFYVLRPILACKRIKYKQRFHQLIFRNC